MKFFGYSQNGRRGIGCGLGNVMKIRDGEPLAGGASAAADFAGIGQTLAQMPAVNPLTASLITVKNCDTHSRCFSNGYATPFYQENKS